jgi:hypothetical protein
MSRSHYVHPHGIESDPYVLADKKGVTVQFISGCGGPCCNDQQFMSWRETEILRDLLNDALEGARTEDLAV